MPRPILRKVSMTADQLTLVKSSFASIGPATDAAAIRFYAQLFALYPALRRLFHGDMREQQRKLMKLLAAVADGLDRPALIVLTVAALAQRHVSYGVVAEHYAIVEEALLWALARS
jgi:nitric oxide dioxygenase